MKKNRTKKIPLKELVNKTFMDIPVPMSITRAVDGTYVEINKAAVKYMGMPRYKIIGRKSADLGHFPEEQRHLFINAIKEQGFAKNIPLELNVKDGIVHMLFSVFPIKMGKELFFLSAATDISETPLAKEKFQDDKFFKITIQDYKYVKGKLKRYDLTKRQQEIALLCATGYSNSEIAKKLFISLYTVKDHQKEIFRITDIHNRMELFPKLLGLR